MLASGKLPGGKRYTCPHKNAVAHKFNAMIEHDRATLESDEDEVPLAVEIAAHADASLPSFEASAVAADAEDGIPPGTVPVTLITGCLGAGERICCLNFVTAGRTTAQSWLVASRQDHAGALHLDSAAWLASGCHHERVWRGAGT